MYFTGQQVQQDKHGGEEQCCSKKCHPTDERVGITKTAAGKACDAFIAGIQNGLKSRGSKVTLVGFGTFKKVYRKTRWGRNPQTGEKLKIKGKNMVTFKASKNFG